MAGKVHTIQINELGDLGVDDEGLLFWKGAPVVTDQRVTLGIVERIAALAGATSSVVLVVVEVLRFFGIGH